MKKITYILGILFILTTSLISSEAFNILKNSFKYNESLKQFSINALVEEKEIQEDGSLFTSNSIVNININRPKQLSMVTQSDTLYREVYLNHGFYILYDKGNDFYNEMEVSDNINNGINEIINYYDIKPPLVSIVYTDIIKKMNFDIIKIMKRTKEYNHILLKNNDLEIHFLISRGDKPLIQRYVIYNLKNKKTTSINLSWNLSPSFNENTFIFKKKNNLTKKNINRRL